MTFAPARLRTITNAVSDRGTSGWDLGRPARRPQPVPHRHGDRVPTYRALRSDSLTGGKNED